MLLLTGCTENQPAANIGQGYHALEGGQYDEARVTADAYLDKSPRGAEAASALYLKGRSFEQRPKLNRDEAARDWDKASASYNEAAKLNPPEPLRSYIYSSQANVAFLREDFLTAVEQWTSSYAGMDKDYVRGWVLYRIGLCQQRLGRLDQADHNFAIVMQQYPNTEPAKLASEHRGARSFYVQVGAFSSPANAEKALNELRALGVTGTRFIDGSMHVARAGPYPTWQAARTVKQKLADKYPKAIIQP